MNDSMKTSPRKRWLIGKVAQGFEELEEDMEATYRAYCKIICSLCRKIGRFKDHTPRCKALQERWGFEPTPIIIGDAELQSYLLDLDHEAVRR